MEIVENLIVDDLIAIGCELSITENLFVSNETTGVESLEYVAKELHIVVDMEFVVIYVDFFAIGVDSLVVDVDEGLLVNHYVQFVLGSEHVDWMVEILVFDKMMQMWMMCKLAFLSLLEWKPLVKMRMVVNLSLDIKV